MKKLFVLFSLLLPLMASAEWGKEWGKFEFEFEQEKPWAELEAQLPPYPKEENLLPLFVSAATDNKFFVDAASISAGQKLYAKACMMCHGQTGKGDGPVVKSMKPEATKPSSLTDDQWDYGSTDGEMFVAIRDGIGPKFEMKGQKGKISEQEIWHLVNYVRSLATNR